MIPISSLTLQPDDEAKWLEGITAGGTLEFTDIHATANINGATCDNINTGG